MAKRSPRSNFRRAKARLVHVWGLISLLDYRHFRSPRKMLIYKRQIGREGPCKSRKEIEKPPKYDDNHPETRVDRERTASVWMLEEKEMGKEPERSDSRYEGWQHESCKSKSTRSEKSQFLSKRNMEGRNKWELECPGQKQGLELSQKDMVEESRHQIYPIRIDETISDSVKGVLNQHGKHRAHANVLQTLQLNFFRKRSNIQETRPSDETDYAEAPEETVTSKPEPVNPEIANPQNTVQKEQRRSVNTGSILSAIKRSLRGVIYTSSDSERSFVDKTFQFKAGEKNYPGTDNSELRVSKIYSHAEEYLPKMLNNGDKESNIMTVAYGDKEGFLQLSESSGCPRGSPKRDAKGNSAVPSEQIVETQLSPCESVVEETAYVTEEHTNCREESIEGASSHGNCSIGQLCEESDDKECEQYLGEDFDDENGPIHSPSLHQHRALYLGMPEDQETGVDRAEQPSPVSVLEPLIEEGGYSTARATSRSRDHPIQLSQIKFEDGYNFNTAQEIYTETLDRGSIIGYIRAVLDGLDLNCDELYLKWQSWDQALDLLMLHRVDFPGEGHFPEKKLLPDCINEVIVEFYSRRSVLPRFNYSNKVNTIATVCASLYWHLFQSPLPLTLDQIIGKDLSVKETWMDLHLEVERLCIYMGEIILQELIIDTFTSFRDSKELAEL
ncbi:hypothetical protein SAY87_020462 [Trapa incisa]|uniref:DUF4378 domain-containing protein n=1 Tax=Trapa incisa TaxID=236973 RepID=A0AAN7JPW6_9MYRT|nr:hypothetical protein SAY87_020462 [Trapa incisa]